MSLLQEERNIIVQNKYADNFDLHIYSARSGQTGGIDAMKGWLADNLIKHFSSFTPEGLADEFTQ